MSDINSVSLSGRLGADPELRYTKDGTPVASLRLAVGRKIKEREETVWIGCTAWQGCAETLAKYVRKGDQIMVSGRLKMDEWEDRETGAKRSKIEIVINDFTFGQKAGAGGHAASPDDDYEDQV